MAETKTTATQVGRDTTDKFRESMAANEFAQKAKDAAYTLVGLGVMGAQKATVATKGAAKQLGGDDASGFDLDGLRSRTEHAKAVALRQLTKADEILEGAMARIEEALAPLEDRLPDNAKDTVSKVREAGKGLHAQVRTRVVGEQAPEAGKDETAPAPKGRKKDADPTA